MIRRFVVVPEPQTVCRVRPAESRAHRDEGLVAAAREAHAAAREGRLRLAQLQELERGCDLLVATPGRLVDFLEPFDLQKQLEN